jgi:hypothetical protein
MPTKKREREEDEYTPNPARDALLRRLAKVETNIRLMEQRGLMETAAHEEARDIRAKLKELEHA